MEVSLAYAQRTQLINSLNSSALSFATNLRREPVAFQGRVKEPVIMRQLLLALREVVVGDFRENERWLWLLDPVITVHPDEIFFEAFSTDESVYGRLSAPLDAFNYDREPVYGTTNIDFNVGLQQALFELRSSRKTDFSIGAGGFGVETMVGTQTQTHFERKVTLPESWLKGFLQVQGALAMKPFTFNVRPADLLTVINYFQDNRAKKPPHGLRFEFKEGEAITAVLEPWEERFTLKGTEYKGYDRVVRLWGRKRLELLLRVLPYAYRVTIGVLGRGLPHFYICHCRQGETGAKYQFTLVLSGWIRNDWSQGSAFDLMASQTKITPEETASVYNYLVQNLKASQNDIEAHTLLESTKVDAALFQLCRGGRVIVDPVARQYRSRELFQEPLNIDELFAPDPRITQARDIVAAGNVQVAEVFPSDTRASEIKALGSVHDEERNEDYEVLVAVDRDYRIRFAQCQCKFFKENIMSRGPCEHIMAVRFAADEAYQKVAETLFEKKEDDARTT